MNTKTKQDQKNQRPGTRQKQGPKKQGQNANMLHEDRKHQDHEHPETRLTR
jgi:hypothetical protein